jgi:hypothetical protein
MGLWVSEARPTTAGRSTAHDLLATRTLVERADRTEIVVILTGYGLLALMCLAIVGYVCWSMGREFGEHTGYNRGWNDALHKTYYEGTEREKT